MTTGTEGDDQLTNDDNQEYETIDALGGDDRITLSNSGVHEYIFITVNGGAGTDTVSITARSANSDAAGTIGVKVSDFRDYSVTHSGVERLEIDVQFVGLLVTGDTQDDIRVRAGTAPTRISTGGGADRIEVDSNYWGSTVDGGDGNDVIVGGNFDFMDNYPNNYADTFHGGAGIDYLSGGRGDDVLDGGSGADYLLGRNGNDVFIVDDVGDRVYEDSAAGGYDTVRSSVSFSLAYQYLERLELTGSADIDATGNSQANTLVGNSGANLLDGGIGVDVMGGRGGNDTYIVDHTGESVIEEAGGGIDTVLSYATFHLSRAYEIENLTLIGSSAVNAYGNHLNNRLEGNGNNNLLNGSAGADIMIGKAGTDTYYVDNEGDVVIEEAGGGVDTVRSVISFTLSDHVENLALEGSADIDASGNALANRISGNTGANRLDGGAGADVMTGGLGDDVYVVDTDGDVVREFDPAGGDDTVLSSVSYGLGYTQIETLQLTGDAAVDATGHSAANTLIGNGAANRLYGKFGNDRLEGGGGADGFFFDTALDASNNVDAILDFSVADDTIHLSRAVFTQAGPEGTLAAGAFRTGTSAQDADDRILYDSATGNVFYDADGSGAGEAILFARVDPGVQLDYFHFFAY